MESLTKQQLVLLGILVSFVTSIATGIVTVSLLDQAPKGVTQTINRVVERTVERVVSEPALNQVASPIITRETVVVSEDDRTSEAIDANIKSTVRVYGTPGIGAPAILAGLGVIASKDGMVAIDGAVLGTGYVSYFIELSSGERIEALPVKGIAGRLGLLRLVSKEGFTPATFADSNNAKLGQTVIALSGSSDLSVAEGIISRLVRESGVASVPESSEVSRAILSIETTARPEVGISGGPLINLSGEVVAILASGVYVPANSVKKTLDAAVAAAAL